MNAQRLVRWGISLLIVASTAFMVGSIWPALVGGLAGYFLTYHVQQYYQNPYRKVTVWYLEIGGKQHFHHLEPGHSPKPEPYTSGSDVPGSWKKKYALRHTKTGHLMVIPRTEN